ncbi:MAG: hypothetical protein Q8M92_01290, partial [Candidatus Subteraquimicrobiales bacterium]|nr:hypothetical protein [Candidatus Subteraquimicrobiales bacterium]
NQDALRFISEIVKPWETLNQELSRPFSLNSEINDYITKAINLAVTIKHLPEATQKIKPETLADYFGLNPATHFGANPASDFGLK